MLVFFFCLPFFLPLPSGQFRCFKLSETRTTKCRAANRRDFTAVREENDCGWQRLQVSIQSLRDGPLLQNQME